MCLSLWHGAQILVVIITGRKGGVEGREEEEGWKGQEERSGVCPKCPIVERKIAKHMYTKGFLCFARANQNTTRLQQNHTQKDRMTGWGHGDREGQKGRQAGRHSDRGKAHRVRTGIWHQLNYSHISIKPWLSLCMKHTNTHTNTNSIHTHTARGLGLFKLDILVSPWVN